MEDINFLQSRILLMANEVWKGIAHEVIIQKRKKKRSLDANSYCWALCDLIAQKLHTTKVEIYQKAIKEVGVFDTIPVRDDAVERWIANWDKNGLGWVCELIGKSKWKGYTNIQIYFGSSTYGTKEMARLIDNLVFWAQELGIPTESKERIEKLKEEWGNK